jgi:phosphatidylserine synthase
MNIEPSLLIVVVCVLISSSLITATSSNIKRTYNSEFKAKDYATSGFFVGFGSIASLVVMILMNNMYLQLEHSYTYYLAWIWTALIPVATLCYLTYDKLLSAKHEPSGSKNLANDNEIKLAFAAFCFALAGISAGLTYVIVSNIRIEYKPKPQKSEQIELDELLSSLTETSF